MPDRAPSGSADTITSRTVILGFGTTIGPAQSRDYFAASLTATPPPPPTTKQEKKASLSVAIQAPSEIEAGDTAVAKITVKAGEKPVHSIRFTGDPLRATAKAVKVVDAPKAPASFSLGADSRARSPSASRASRWEPPRCSRPRRAPAPAAVPSPAPGEPLSKVAESALQVSLSTVPSELMLAVTDEGKVLPQVVSVEVRLKNTTARTMRNVSVTGLFPQPVAPGSTADQLAFDKNLLPIKVGTFAGGGTFKRALPLQVTGDGEFEVRAVAQYAGARRGRRRWRPGRAGGSRSRCRRAGSRRLEKSGQLPASRLPVGASGAWVKAGGTVLITGKVRNLSSYKTLCLAPLRARGSGNAGRTGPVVATYAATRSRRRLPASSSRARTCCSASG